MNSYSSLNQQDNNIESVELFSHSVIVIKNNLLLTHLFLETFLLTNNL